MKEASVNKSELVADVDFIDVATRQENLTTIPGVPVMIQMPLQPSYGLTTSVSEKNTLRHLVANVRGGIGRTGCYFAFLRIHKTQALSTVDGPNANCAPVFGPRIVARV